MYQIVGLDRRLKYLVKSHSGKETKRERTRGRVKISKKSMISRRIVEYRKVLNSILTSCTQQKLQTIVTVASVTVTVNPNLDTFYLFIFASLKYTII